MTTHIETISIQNAGIITINVQVEEPITTLKFLDFGTPMTQKTVELLSEDGSTILQTTITDSDGITQFTNVIHGNYSVRITY